MGLRMPTFVCDRGHKFDQLVEAGVTVTECRCGAQARAKIGAPSVKSAERVSRDEVKQYLAQFGQWDREKKAWKFIPKNRDELNVALKQEGMTTVSAKEFEQLATAPKPESPPPSVADRAAMIEQIKKRREEFRSAYDSGNLPKQEVPSDVKEAVAQEIGSTN